MPLGMTGGEGFRSRGTGNCLRPLERLGSGAATGFQRGKRSQRARDLILESSAGV
jgi:hypothetical protein